MVKNDCYLDGTAVRNDYLTTGSLDRGRDRERKREGTERRDELTKTCEPVHLLQYLAGATKRKDTFPDITAARTASLICRL